MGGTGEVVNTEALIGNPKGKFTFCKKLMDFCIKVRN